MGGRGWSPMIVKELGVPWMCNRSLICDLLNWEFSTLLLWAEPQRAAKPLKCGECHSLPYRKGMQIVHLGNGLNCSRFPSPNQSPPALGSRNPPKKSDQPGRGRYLKILRTAGWRRGASKTTIRTYTRRRNWCRSQTEATKTSYLNIGNDDRD